MPDYSKADALDATYAAPQSSETMVYAWVCLVRASKKGQARDKGPQVMAKLVAWGERRWPIRQRIRAILKA